jgi:hypothetical protein
MAAVTAAVIGGAAMIGSAVMQGEEAKKARARANSLGGQIADLERNRQGVVNPFSSIKDLSSEIKNPYANLTVSTKSAELEAAQADVTLANTLDVLRDSGGTSGSATAIAQLAMQSKQSIAADLRKQEEENNKLRVQGEMQVQQMKLAEKQRVQEGQARGKEFVFNAQEAREMQKLNRLSGMQDQQLAQSAAANSAMWSSIGGLGGSLIAAGVKGASKDATGKTAVDTTGKPSTGAVKSPIAPLTSELIQRDQYDGTGLLDKFGNPING